VVYEYPRAEGDAYYPIPQPANAALYAKYRALAQAMPDVHFIGRLGTYRYYNMDQVVGQALTLYKKLVSRESAREPIISRSAIPDRLSREPLLPAGSLS
jgi:UDP-galactopyranose mutase